ncbi:hypothetical protein I317_00951 [Kwoniella heveanensis CBS 569]|nr:hypothetical protein I317_00951 [Kwoniella heveanensis CBS 569]
MSNFDLFASVDGPGSKQSLLVTGMPVAAVNYFATRSLDISHTTPAHARVPIGDSTEAAPVKSKPRGVTCASRRTKLKRAAGTIVTENDMGNGIPPKRESPPPYEVVKQYPSPIDPSPSSSPSSLDSIARIDGHEVGTAPARPVQVGLQTHASRISSTSSVLARDATASATVDERCALLGHEPKTRYGAVGIIAGVVFFPWGLFWRLLDYTFVLLSIRVQVVNESLSADSRRYVCFLFTLVAGPAAILMSSANGATVFFGITAARSARAARAGVADELRILFQ